MKNKILIAFALFGVSHLMVNPAHAQSNFKEASNNFALYTKTGEIKNLEAAKRFIDESYKTRRDSSNARNIVLRSLVYSSLAYVDSTRKIKTDRDPIFIARDAMRKLRPNDVRSFESEVDYIKQNLAAAMIYKANKALEQKDFATSYDLYYQVDQLKAKNEDVTYNLALLASKSKKYKEAIGFYEQILASGNSTAAQHLELAEVFKQNGDLQKSLTTLEKANNQFANNKSIIFKLVEEYAANNVYSALVPIVDEAIRFEPENVKLNYLAGYANETEGNLLKAKSYYQKVLELEVNNYEANLALGLLSLDDFLKNNDNQEAQYNAQNYLLKANEIRPYDINALKSLALYYKTAQDEAQLDRVNLLLNQLSNN